MPTQRESRHEFGSYELFRPSLGRQLASDAFAAIRGGHPMIGMLELDVTAPLAKLAVLQARGTRVSLFAHVVRAIAVAITEHPDMNLVRHGKRLVRFDDVDISIPVEVDTHEGRSPREVVIRRAQDLTASQIFAQLEAARAQHRDRGTTGTEDRWAQRTMALIRWLPTWLRIAVFRFYMRDAFRIKAHAGTTLVTSVGKFADIPGFSITFSTGPRAAVFVVGGVTRKPWVHDEQIVPREVLSLSVIVDHDLVDGAPAARFAQRLRDLVESDAIRA